MSRSKLTLRQLCAATACALLLPTAALLSRCAWPWVLGGAAVGVVYYYNVYRRSCGFALEQAAERCFGRAAPILRWLHAGALLLLTALLSQQVGALFPETAGKAWVGLGVLLLATYAASKGLAVVLRCGAVLFLPLSLICGAVPLLAAQNAHAQWLWRQGDLKDFGLGLLLLLTPLSLGWLAPQVQRKDARPRRWAIGLGLAAALTAAVSSACLSPALAALPMSFGTLARSVSAFGVMLRLESFVSGALTASAFSGMALLLCTAAAAAPISAHTGRAVPYFALVTAVISLLPASVLTPSAAAAAIFCAAFPPLTQALVACKKPQKKSDFLQKKC